MTQTSFFVSPQLWAQILKNWGPYALRHLRACYPGAVFYVVEQSLQLDPYIQPYFDQCVNNVVEDIQEGSLVVAPVTTDSYCNFWCLRREANNQLRSDEAWGIAVATAMFAAAEPDSDLSNLKYLTEKRLGFLEMPQVVHSAVNR